MGFFSGLVNSVAGPLIGGLLGKKGQDDANEQNIALSREQMDFQERMSNTAHQREVKDLAAAGLNPMLSAKLGGSSTPVGSLAKVENSTAAGLNSAASALNSALVRSQIEVSDTQAEVNRATAEKVKTDSRLSLASAMQGEYAVRMNDYEEKYGTPGQARVARTLADVSEHSLRKLSSEMDESTLTALTQRARRMGFYSFNEAISDLDFRRSLQDFEIRKLDIPRGKALSDFYSTSFGREVAPYLNSANDMVNIGAGAVGTGIKLFRKH